MSCRTEPPPGACPSRDPDPVRLAEDSAHQVGPCGLKVRGLPSRAHWTSPAWCRHPWPVDSPLSVPLSFVLVVPATVCASQRPKRRRGPRAGRPPLQMRSLPQPPPCSPETTRHSVRGARGPRRVRPSASGLHLQSEGVSHWRNAAGRGGGREPHQHHSGQGPHAARTLLTGCTRAAHALLTGCTRAGFPMGEKKAQLQKHGG